MDRFLVDISPAALNDIRKAFHYIHERSPQNAQSWLRRLYERIDTLETMPERCGLIRECYAFEEEVRELLHFSHRVIFTVDKDRSLVQVLTVRHAARDELLGDEV